MRANAEVLPSGAVTVAVTSSSPSKIAFMGRGNLAVKLPGRRRPESRRDRPEELRRGARHAAVHDAPAKNSIV